MVPAARTWIVPVASRICSIVGASNPSASVRRGGRRVLRRDQTVRSARRPRLDRPDRRGRSSRSRSVTMAVPTSFCGCQVDFQLRRRSRFQTGVRSDNSSKDARTSRQAWPARVRIAARLPSSLLGRRRAGSPLAASRSWGRGRSCECASGVVVVPALRAGPDQQGWRLNLETAPLPFPVRAPRPCEVRSAQAC